MEHKQTKSIRVGSVTVGGGAPISVQSMCNTHTADVKATTEQIARLHDLGCEIIRLAVPDQQYPHVLLSSPVIPRLRSSGLLCPPQRRIPRQMD